jgi:hypothetical protein
MHIKPMQSNPQGKSCIFRLPRRTTHHFCIINTLTMRLAIVSAIFPLSSAAVAGPGPRVDDKKPASTDDSHDYVSSRTLNPHFFY